LSPGADSVSVSTGTSVSDAISVIGANGFDAAVSFSASGLPAGVTAAFSPASSSTGTILALKSAATTVAGSYSIVITGTSSATATSNALQQTTTITLVVASSSASGFTLTPASGTLKVALNQSGSEGIVVKAVNGFSGVVVLNVSGLPSGATSGFLCDTLLVSVPAGTATGTYPLTITGISGTKTATTTVSLVVEP
jgi:hypothetical protein